MKARWLAFAARFSAMSQRERAMVAVAAVAVLIYIGDTLWISPIYGRAQSFSRQAMQQQKDLAALQQQLYQLQAESTVDPNAGVKAALAQAQAELGQVNAKLAAFESTLVAPSRMPELLDRVLHERRGVRLVSLKTLPVQAITAGGAPEKAADGSTPEPVALLYRHGYELTVEGSYLDVLAWLGELESVATQLLWQRSQLVSGNEGRVRLTLGFHTLSLDKAWGKL